MGCPTAGHGSGTRDRLPGPRLTSTHRHWVCQGSRCSGHSGLCHQSDVPLFALLREVVWDWQEEGTGRELGGTGWLFDFCTTAEIYPTTVKFTEFCSWERIWLLDAFETLRLHLSSLCQGDCPGTDGSLAQEKSFPGSPGTHRPPVNPQHRAGLHLGIQHQVPRGA